MRTYAVFGMTRPAANVLARKKLIAKKVEHISERVYEGMVRDESDVLMAGTRITMLSDKFDAPQFAEKFLGLAKKHEHRDLHIKAYCKVGTEQTPTGKQKMHWRAYP